jgi:hypothetical protein
LTVKQEIEYFRCERVGRRVGDHQFALHNGAHFDHQVARGIWGQVRYPPPEWVAAASAYRVEIRRYPRLQYKALLRLEQGSIKAQWIKAQARRDLAAHLGGRAAHELFVAAVRTRHLEQQRCRRQFHLHFCTSKASKLSTWRNKASPGHGTHVFSTTLSDPRRLCNSTLSPCNPTRIDSPLRRSPSPSHPSDTESVVSRRPVCQYLYFCTCKACKMSTSRRLVQRASRSQKAPNARCPAQRCICQNFYFCTSKASKFEYLRSLTLPRGLRGSLRPRRRTRSCSYRPRTLYIHAYIYTHVCVCVCVSE